MLASFGEEPISHSGAPALRLVGPIETGCGHGLLGVLDQGMIIRARRFTQIVAFKLADPKMRFGEVEFLLQFHSSELEIVPMRGHNFRPDETADLAHIDLAGEGGSDEDGALFL